ncbi:hypothetical protein H4R18_003584 [Coemansia javaensis]|uniref:Uncharacterized protein n=1 Tax=Coemansia javaensis TaxID=2761396 RepID=A0A9W8LIC3_9FUNG|nr:hypothetical protein H4R18_003584 [Coemansia javaensis]
MPGNNARNAYNRHAKNSNIFQKFLLLVIYGLVLATYIVMLVTMFTDPENAQISYGVEAGGAFGASSLAFAKAELVGDCIMVAMWMVMTIFLRRRYIGKRTNNTVHRYFAEVLFLATQICIIVSNRTFNQFIGMYVGATARMLVFNMIGASLGFIVFGILWITMVFARKSWAPSPTRA